MDNTMIEHRLEVICHTEEDRQRLIMDHILPDYLSGETKQAIKATQWKNTWEVFIPHRNRRRAEREQCYPVVLTA